MVDEGVDEVNPLQRPFQSLDGRRRNCVVLDSRGLLEKDCISVPPVPNGLSPLDFAYFSVDENLVAHLEGRILNIHGLF